MRSEALVHGAYDTGRRRHQAYVRVVLQRAAIARSTWPSAARRRVRHSVSAATQRLGHELVRAPAPARTSPPRTPRTPPAGRPREAHQVLLLAAARARAELRRQPRRQQQLQAERPAPSARAATAECSASTASARSSSVQLAAQQVEHARVRAPRSRTGAPPRRTPAPPRPARARRRAGARGRPIVCGARHRQQAPRALRAARCSSGRTAPGARRSGCARAPHALRDRGPRPACRRVQVQDAIRLAVTHRAQHHRFRLHSSAGHAHMLIHPPDDRRHPNGQWRT